MKLYLENLFIKLADKLEYLKSENIMLSVPNNKEQGDYSTNLAMRLSKKLKKNPRAIAEELKVELSIIVDSSIIKEIRVEGPGFINFFFTLKYISEVISKVLLENENYGKLKKYSGKKAIVEFVSANPTGPLTIGHGRNAVVGDTFANMLEFIGYSVTREYYFNNAGRQMRVLGNSVKLRYLELLGDSLDFPDDHYQGEYIKDIASIILKEKGNNLREEPAEGIFKDYAERLIFDDIKNSLKNIGIVMDTFFNENDLYTEKKIDKVLELFAEKGLSYEKEGATWLKLSEMGNEQDKVIIKSTGEPTYRLPDIAYHITKFERGYDLIVDLFGSDHNATYPDVLAALKYLNYDIDKVKVLIHQFVTVVAEGKVVKMSTRKANFITLDELVEEAGRDAVRYFFIMRDLKTHLNFDIELAKKSTDENPVFYLQYAHARISSILRLTEKEGLKENTENLTLLNTEEELEIIKKLHHFSDDIEYAALNFEPNKVSNYLEELATLFHRFYASNRILGSEKKLAEARIALVKAVKQVLNNGLKILSVNAPDRM
ncbi:MAG TPA: arginine--tRNA ligase [Melioribacteraceae bacterium]|nr:arginine--tRNA ligase [Melioribacteraceae bacterium]